MTFADIAEQCGLDEEDAKRVLRLVMTDYIYAEPKEGVVAHIAASHALSTNAFLDAWVGLAAQEIWPGFIQTTDALAKWLGSESPLETAFHVAHDFKDNPFVEWERDHPRAERFSDAMKLLHSGYNPIHFLSNYDFSSRDSSLLVDVGGSHGEVIIGLAQKYPDLKCGVQDSQAEVVHVNAQVPEDLEERVKLMVDG